MNILKKIGAGIGIICTPIAFFDTIGAPATVVGCSMEPTLHGSRRRWWENDIVWLNRWFGEPQCGDIFTFVTPSNPRAVHVKRVNLLPGQLARGRDGTNIIVPDNHYWMTADNAAFPLDSTTYGPV
ncbi:Protein IMMP-2 [Aphelenchoides avenae]|nr:Protein IMMP-2 [Aphelenchus avenae]